MKSLGFDGAFDYHVDGDYFDLLDEHCPDGVDCFFDNFIVSRWAEGRWLPG